MFDLCLLAKSQYVWAFKVNRRRSLKQAFFRSCLVRGTSCCCAVAEWNLFQEILEKLQQRLGVDTCHAPIAVEAP